VFGDLVEVDITASSAILLVSLVRRILFDVSLPALLLQVSLLLRGMVLLCGIGLVVAAAPRGAVVLGHGWHFCHGCLARIDWSTNALA
jgi:hypothetical protein